MGGAEGVGVQWVRRRKYLQKKLALGKCSSSAICVICMSLWRSMTLAAVITARSIHSLAVMPLVWRTTEPS